MAEFKPDDRPAFTRYKAASNISKGFKWDAKNGKLLKTPHGHLFAGLAEILYLKDPEHLVRMLTNATPKQAFGWGISAHPVARITTGGNLPADGPTDPQNPLIARTRDFFSYPPNRPGVMMFDVDPPKDGSAKPLTLDQAIAAMHACCPTTSSTPMVCSCSSSSHIWRGDEELIGARGYHIYVFVKDASDIPRAGKVMLKRSWLKGYGRIEIGSAGQLLERSFIDGAVYQPERLDFGMKAHCVGVEQRQTPPTVRNADGPMLDTRTAFPDLTSEEEAHYRNLVSVAKKAREVDARPIREAWADKQVREILLRKKTTPELAPGEADQIRERLCRASEGFTLDADMILHPDSGAPVTVGEILLDLEKWRNRRFADPLEPDYGGDPRIAYLSEKGGKWGIYSHAHGGVRYTLPIVDQVPTDNPGTGLADAIMGFIDAMEAELPKVTENYQNPEPIKPLSTNPFDNPLDVAELLETPPAPMQWFAKDRMPQGRGLLLTGVGGTSKSTMLKQLGFAAVIGRALWNWEFERAGKALLMLTEDTRDDVHASVKDIALAMALTPEERAALVRNLAIYPFAGNDSRLLIKGASGRLERGLLFDQLLARVQAMGDCVFVGLDPALALSDGDELDQQSQRALSKMADDLAVRTGATVVLVTHASKGLINAEEVGSHSSRGGGAVTDGARGEYVLRSMTAQEAKRAGIDDPEERARMVQFVACKGNRIPPAAKVPVWLRRGDGGVLSEVVLDMTKGATCTTAAQDEHIYGVLMDLGNGGAVKLQDWQAACEARGVLTGKTDSTKRQYMKNAATRLTDAGQVERFKQGYYIPCNQESDQEW